MLPDSNFSLDSTAPISRRHHYVPKFLLSRFAIDRALWATDVVSGRQWLTSPNRTGFENDYNTVPSSKVREDVGELILAELDQMTAPVIARCVSTTLRQPA
jgi:hypothetical protein